MQGIDPPIVSFFDLSEIRDYTIREMTKEEIEKCIPRVMLLWHLFNKF